MARQSEDALELAAVLEQNRQEIGASWAERVHRLPDSHYRELSAEELRDSTVRGLGAMVEALNTGSYAALETYLTDVSLTRLQMGFDSGEVIEALLLCKDAALPVIRRIHPPDSGAAWALTTPLDACLRWVVKRFSDLYAAEAGRLLQEQHERTAMMLDAAQTASSSLELDEVLRRVGWGVARAAGVPHCGFFLVDEGQGIYEPKFEVTVPSFRATACPLGIPVPMPTRALAAAGAFFRQVVEEKEPLVCCEVQTDPRFETGPARPLGIKSVLAVPSVVKGRVVAVAWAFTYDDFCGFTAEQIELARGLVNATALAIENARLYQQVEQVAVTQERARLSREIHDELAQTLGALQLRASMIGELLSDGQVAQAQANLMELGEMISEAYTDVREEIFCLRAVISPEVGFLPTLRAYLADYQAYYGVQVRLEAGEEREVELTGAGQVEAIRIIQEALANVRKHAGTHWARVRIERCGEQARISVEDAGQGFDLAEAGGQSCKYFGLQVMRERAESAGGTLVVESQPARGTRVVLQMPLSPKGVAA
jgi:signal transduction histidine kinase